MVLPKQYFLVMTGINQISSLKNITEVIGVIIMADGDNTNSKFETQLKSISLDLKILVIMIISHYFHCILIKL